MYTVSQYSCGFQESQVHSVTQISANIATAKSTSRKEKIFFSHMDFEKALCLAMGCKFKCGEVRDTLAV